MKNRRPTRTIVTAAVLGLALLTVIPLAAQARGKGGQPPSPEQAAERMTRQLDLTDQQQEQVRAVLEGSFEQHQIMREQHRQDRDATRAETEEQLAAILTVEQMDELRSLQEDRQHRRRGCDQGKGRAQGKDCGNCEQLEEIGCRQGDCQDRRRGCDQGKDRGNCGPSTVN